MKNSPNQHCCQTRVADGTSPLLFALVTATLTLGTTSFPLEGKGNLLLTVNSAISIIFKFLHTLIGAKLDLGSFRPYGGS